jgi:hypothetical protein
VEGEYSYESDYQSRFSQNLTLMTLEVILFVFYDIVKITSIYLLLYRMLNQNEFLTPQRKLAQEIITQLTEYQSQIEKLKPVILLVIQIIYSSKPVDQAPYKQHFDQLNELLADKSVFQAVMAQIHSGMDTLRDEHALTDDEMEKIDEVLPYMPLSSNSELNILLDNISYYSVPNTPETEDKQEFAYHAVYTLWVIFNGCDGKIDTTKAKEHIHSFNTLSRYNLDERDIAKIVYLTHYAWKGYQDIINSLY